MNSLLLYYYIPNIPTITTNIQQILREFLENYNVTVKYLHFNKIKGKILIEIYINNVEEKNKTKEKIQKILSKINGEEINL